MEKIEVLIKKIENLEADLHSLREALIRQNNLILRLGEKLIEIQQPKKQENKPFFSSNGSKGVNQSINNQSLNTEKSLKNKPKIEPITPKINISTRNEGVQEPLAHTKHSIIEGNKTSVTENKDDLAQLSRIKDKLNLVFKKISRQELKTFLTIYQLEEDGVNPTYKAISESMGLSEHCIRAHVCSLMKKSAPIEKSKINNRLILIYVKKDFKILNLKKQLLTLYYRTDPDQTTLLEN